MVLGFECLGRQLNIINWVKGYCVVCSFKCRFKCNGVWGRERGCHGVGMCVSGIETCPGNWMGREIADGSERGLRQCDMGWSKAGERLC